MAILITGGLGYIGSHTCVELVQAGYEPVILDNLSNSRLAVLDRIREITGAEIPFYRIDLLDADQVDGLFRKHAVEAVVHFAGLKAVGESVAHPLMYYRNNVAGTLVLCGTMQRHGVKKLVFSSSATVYRAKEEGPVAEDDPLGPVNPYGQSKRMIEQILCDLAASDPEWSVALLRYFNPVGAHPSGRIGEDPSGIPNNLTPYITRVAAGKLPELRVFGADYPTRDGTGVRDYIHVMDLAAGHVKAIRKVTASRGVEAYNLGRGEGYSVLEMIRAFEEATGRPIPYTVAERRPGDIAVCYADPSKAERELQWRAARGLREMCADAWRWQSRNPNGYAEDEST